MNSKVDIARREPRLLKEVGGRGILHYLRGKS